MGYLLLIVAGTAILIVVSILRSPRPGTRPYDRTLESIADEPLRDLMAGLRRPCMLLRKSPEDAATSHLGGRPPQYPGFAWPERDGVPMGFLAHIDLAPLQSIDWLPRAGRLLFFYDLATQPWGFDPKDRGAWAVIHVPDAGVFDGESAPPAGMPEQFALPKVPVAFTPAESAAPWDHPATHRFNLTNRQSDALGDAQDAVYGEHPRHQIGGHACPVQSSEMELQCQLVSHGLFCGDPSGYTDPRAESLKAGADDWRLLLQIDSDTDLDMMWGDVGMLYFWVREQEAKASDFSNCWVVMQCH